MGYKVIPGFSNYEINEDAVIRNCKSKYTLLPRTHSRDGYLYIRLYNDDKIQQGKNLHRFLAMAHIPNPHNYPNVLHKDDVKTNNSLDNLYWGNQSMNLKDCYRNGFKSIQSKPVLQYNLKNEFIMKHESIRTAAKYIGGKENAIQNCVAGRCQTSNGFRWTYAVKGGVCVSD